MLRSARRDAGPDDPLHGRGGPALRPPGDHGPRPHRARRARPPTWWPRRSAARCWSCGWRRPTSRGLLAAVDGARARPRGRRRPADPLQRRRRGPARRPRGAASLPTAAGRAARRPRGRLPAPHRPPPARLGAQAGGAASASSSAAPTPRGPRAAGRRSAAPGDPEPVEQDLGDHQQHHREGVAAGQDRPRGRRSPRSRPATGARRSSARRHADPGEREHRDRHLEHEPGRPASGVVAKPKYSPARTCGLEGVAAEVRAGSAGRPAARRSTPKATPATNSAETPATISDIGGATGPAPPGSRTRRAGRARPAARSGSPRRSTPSASKNGSVGERVISLSWKRCGQRLLEERRSAARGTRRRPRRPRPAPARRR